MTVRTPKPFRKTGGFHQEQSGDCAQGAGTDCPKEERTVVRKPLTFHHALRFLPFQHIPGQWAVTQNNLADTYYAMEEWGSDECYANLMEKAPPQGSGSKT
ncbi:MAG: hypothetical protein R2941_22745 [Desulfobacterales bacterium]